MCVCVTHHNIEDKLFNIKKGAKGERGKWGKLERVISLFGRVFGISGRLSERFVLVFG